MASPQSGPGELAAGASGLLLLLVMLLPWFGIDASFILPGNAEPITVDERSLNAWDSFAVIDLILAATAVSAMSMLLLREFSWAPVWLALAVTAAAALSALLIVFRLLEPPSIAVIERPDVAVETGRRLGLFFGLLCTAGIAWGANRVASESRPGAGESEAAGDEVEPAPAAPTPPRAALEPPGTVAVARPLGDWTRADIEAECAAVWRRYDRRLGQRYAHYFAEHPELRGEGRSSARDLAAALPPGWGELAEALPAEHWARDHLAGKSTQTLAVGLFGVAARGDHSLGWLFEALASGSSASAREPRLEFAHRVAPELMGEPAPQTNIDVLVDHPHVVVCVKTKWREAGVAACTCRGNGVGPLSGRCARRVEERDAYWEAAGELLALPRRGPSGFCPISPLLEIVRAAAAAHALAGTGRRALLVLVHDAENPYFAGVGEWPGWPALLGATFAANADADGFRFVSLSWQDLMPAMPLDQATRTWAAEKHGLPGEDA